MVVVKIYKYAKILAVKSVKSIAFAIIFVLFRTPFIFSEEAEGFFDSMDVVVQAGHVPGRIFDVSSDGMYIISNAAESPVVALLRRDGTILRKFITSLSSVNDIAFLPGDDGFVCGGISEQGPDQRGEKNGYRSVEIWDLYGNMIRTSEEPSNRISDIEVRTGSFFSSRQSPAAVHPSGLLAGVDPFSTAKKAPETLSVFDLQGNSLMSLAIPEGITYLTDIQFSPDGSRLYGGGHGEIVFGEGPGSLSEMYPGGLWYWDVETGDRTELVNVEDGMDILNGFTVTETGNVAAVFRQQKEVQEGVYTYYEEHSLLYVWDRNNRFIGKQEAKDPDLNIVAGDDGTIFTLLHDGFRMYSVDLEIQSEIRCVGKPVPSVSVNGRGEVAAKRADGTIYVWDGTGGLLRTLPGRPVNPLYAPMQLFPDGGIMETFMEGYHHWGPHGELVNAKDSVDWIRFETCLSPLGYIARFGERGGVEVYDREGNLLHSFAPAEGRWFLRFNTNGEFLGIFYYDGSCELYDTVKWELRYSLSVGEIPEPNCVRISPAGDYVISLGYRSAAIVSFTDGGKRVRTGGGHNPYMAAEYHQAAIRPDGREFATAYGDMKVMIWDLRGKLVRVLEGLKSPCTSLTYSPDGRHIYAGGFDGSVRVWNRQNGQSAVYYADGDDWLLYTDDGYFDASPRGGRLVRLVDGLNAYLPEQFGMFKNRPDIILERLELGDRESRRYFFLTYLDRLAKRVPVPERVPENEFTGFLRGGSSNEVRRLLLSLYGRKDDGQYHLLRRPDVEEKYRLFLHAPFHGYVEKRALQIVDVPKASFSVTGQEGRTAVLDLSLSSEKSALKNYNIIVNGVPVYPHPGKEIIGKRYRCFEKIELDPGENIVEVTCVNTRLIESLRVSKRIYWEGRTDGKLYYAGLGVSDYKDDRLDLLYPAKDIADMERSLRKAAGEVEEASSWPAGFFSFTAVNRECRRDVTARVERFLREAGVDDTVVLFISGHGMHTRDERSNYYFLTYETDLDNVEQTALPFHRLEDVLARCKARKKLMLMDTCESGELSFIDLSENDFKQRGDNGLRPRTIRGLRMREEEYLSGNQVSDGTAGDGKYGGRDYVYQRNRYINNDVFLRSGTVVFSSSKGGEVSFEPGEYLEEENGFFTRAFLDGMSSVSTDADGDGALSITELEERVYAAVTERTGYRQNPTIDRDNPLSRLALPFSCDLQNSNGAVIAEYLLRIVESGKSDYRRLDEFLGRYRSETGTSPGIIGGAALVRAAELGKRKEVELLLAYGTDPGSAVLSENASSNHSAASRALEMRYVEIAELLINRGAPIPPYYVITAKEQGKLPRLRNLIEKGRPVEAESRRAAVIEASWLGYWDVVEVLLKTGADPNTKDSEGTSLLAAAVDQNSRQAVSMLVEYGADIDIRDKRGNTPLIRAAGSNNFEMVRLLVESGAETNAANRRGDTPLSEAGRRKNSDMYEYLRSRLED